MEYTCKVCHELFETREELYEHYNDEHESRS